MRAGLIIIALSLGWLAAAEIRDFSGIWSLDRQLSNLRNLPAAPGDVLTVSQQGLVFHCAESDVTWSFRADGAERAKREGAALRIDTLVGGPEAYRIEDRWELSDSREMLTITRTMRRGGAVTEAKLIYRRLSPDPAAAGPSVVVKAGTKIPLSLVSSLNTKGSAEGDRVYLETAFPIAQGGRMVIPKGSYVSGTVTEVKRAGQMKGKAQLFLRFDSLTLPNGVTREFRARPDSADGNDVDRQEGKISGDSNKTGDARTVGEGAGAGATAGSIAGSIAGHGAMGTGVGAVAGAVAGLAAVLVTRGPDLILPKGTTLEMVLDRDLRYDPRELTPPAVAPKH